MVAGVLILISVLLLWILFAPLHLVCDTRSGRYYISQPLIFLFAFHPGNIPLFEMRLFGIKLPLDTGSKPARGPQPAKKRRKPFKRSVRAWRSLIANILNSFRIKQLKADVDTGNVVLNAKLVPLMMWLSRGRASLKVNFEGRLHCQVRIEAYVYKMVWTFLRFLTSK